ncbi:hypothetical protein SERLADRAFT_431792 [Serpula lacrymans var. lacrymans S7.9]|nr:uncharacterized protein SERLADRAFT_431792 [Serpula lacrymans var. lacrymans S7.9]EGO30291.1 hypothetical protein SERLADRAFT_431792 [Serpula lacrymans var. lacrymans S7.9]
MSIIGARHLVTLYLPDRQSAPTTVPKTTQQVASAGILVARTNCKRAVPDGAEQPSRKRVRHPSAKAAANLAGTTPNTKKGKGSRKTKLANYKSAEHIQSDVENEDVNVGGFA